MLWPLTNVTSRTTVLIVIVSFACLILLSYSVLLWISKSSETRLRIGSSVLSTTPQTIEIQFFRDTNEVLELTLGCIEKSPSCAHAMTPNQVKCTWAQAGSVVHVSELNNHSPFQQLKCTNFVWVAANHWDVLKDCFRLRSAHWYGGGHRFHQQWPIEKGVLSESAFLPGSLRQDPKSTDCGVGERFWLSSRGAVIVVKGDVPLFVSLNETGDGRLCLIGKNAEPYRTWANTPPTLEYTVCVGETMLTVYQDVFKMFFSLPSDVPDEHLILQPTWSERQNVSEDNIMKMVDEIEAHEFPPGVLLVTDNWENCYGELSFDKARFFNSAGLSRSMYPIRLALKVHPFAIEECRIYSAGKKMGFWIMGEDKTYVQQVETPFGVGALLDMTNDLSVEWWTQRLEVLKEDNKIDSYHFAAGEATWMPSGSRLKEDVQPNVFSTRYAEAAASLFSRGAILQVGCRTQHLPVSITLACKEPNWDRDSGLRTLVPTALHFGLLGYPFLMIEVVGVQEDVELYIRWLQVSAFFPIIHFTVLPWRFADPLVERVARKMMALHEWLAPRLLSLAVEATQNVTPIMRPLWWIDPLDPVAQSIDSEFLVGDLLIAPILEANARKRDVYLPSGSWEDQLRDCVHIGPIWLNDYRIELEEVSYFIQLN